jgi:hypothetical protein
MQSRDRYNYGNRNTPFFPISRGSPCRHDDVRSKYNAPRGCTKVSTESLSLDQRRTCESECDSLNGKNDRDQELGSAIGGLEVDFLSSAARYHTSELEPHT